MFCVKNAMMYAAFRNAEGGVSGSDMCPLEW